MLMSMALFATAQNRFNQDQNKNQNEKTPGYVRDYVDNHFSGQEIERVNKNRESDNEEYYDVNLKNGTELRFNDQDSIVRIQGKDLMQSALPAKEYEYTHKNYLNQKVVSWENKDGQQMVTLDDNTVLTFDPDGMHMSKMKNRNYAEGQISNWVKWKVLLKKIPFTKK